MTVALAAVAVPPVLDLSARLAAVDAAMAVRLDEANVAFGVNTAYIPAAPPVEITAPLPLTPVAAPDPHTTPIAGLLHRAAARIVRDGWCRDAIYDDAGAVCPIRAIRLEAGSRREADDACVLLLDVIQDELPDVPTIPSWNATQTSAAPVLAALDRAARTAANRSL
ncbi:hypothetical protein MUK60_07435 [Streptomyces sp. LRE541]|uniref:DUF6197 family protein n=1 Tax=Streptomyces sp. LRE541 TaxID=2931983 RepID=UPI002010B61B|nr:hypothetical protein [Streptomyces sp. LRE541]UPZ27665.1 hypothetical protein MUK60_07435 [Streptomyces sp. LRE541]